MWFSVVILVVFLLILIALLIYAISQMGLGTLGSSPLTIFDDVNRLDNSDISSARKNKICSFTGYRKIAVLYENAIQVGSKVYNMDDIDTVYLSPSSFSSRGYLQIVIAGQKVIKSVNEAIMCENVLPLEALGQNKAAARFKEKILNAISTNIDIMNMRLDKVADKFKFDLKDVTTYGAILWNAD